MLRVTILALTLGVALGAKSTTNECEVCVANLEAIDKLLDSSEKTSKESIVEAIDKHCGDLQNSKPNPALGPKDVKMCYYMVPIKRAIAQPFSTRKPKQKVCQDLKKQNPEICEVKYPTKVESALPPEEMLAKLKKMRIKDLRNILQDRGVDSAKIKNFVEKDEYINEILATQHMEF